MTSSSFVSATPRGSISSSIGSTAKNVSLLPSESAFTRNSLPASELLKRILSRTTCQPLSLKNFQDYLQFKEHSAENLLFWNWYKRYRIRFHNLSGNQRALSAAPPLSPTPTGPKSPTTDSMRIPKLRISGTDQTIGGDFSRSAQLTTTDLSSLQAVGSSIQPLRNEVDMVISRFLTPGASCELNVSPAVRNRTLEMARTSTHPDVFKEVAEAAYHLMESSSLPNFVKYATSNINTPKKNFWLYVGTTDFMIGVLIYFLCIFLRAGRGFRVFGVPFTWFGCMQFYSATQDLCFQVYGRSARQLYPWDLEDPAHSSSEKDLESGKDTSSDSFDWETITSDTNLVSPTSSTFKVRSPRKSKVFEKEVPIEDEYVKKVQRARYVRTWVVATTIACIFVAVFLGVPNLPR